MRNILTAEQFLIAILAVLKVRRIDQMPEDGSLDQRFERIYEKLIDQVEKGNLNVTPNFTFYRNPLHGNSTRLRNALLAARESGLLAADVGPRPSYRLTMSEERARAYLRRSPLRADTLEGLVGEDFPKSPAVVAG